VAQCPPVTTQTTAKPARPHSVRLRVSDDELEFLRRVAAAEERTIASVLRIALSQFYDRRDLK
jgi:hypothetical protein